jgi:hypothetical protein
MRWVKCLSWADLIVIVFIEIFHIELFNSHSAVSVVIARPGNSLATSGLSNSILSLNFWQLTRQYVFFIYKYIHIIMRGKKIYLFSQNLQDKKMSSETSLLLCCRKVPFTCATKILSSSSSSPQPFFPFSFIASLSDRKSDIGHRPAAGSLQHIPSSTSITYPLLF